MEELLYKRPAKITEANIQAEFYHQCKLNGINCYLEFTHGKCRFDAIIYNNEGVVRFIVEFKSYKTNRPEIIDTGQIKRYSSYNIPVIMITRMQHIENVISKLKTHIHGKTVHGHGNLG